MKEDVSLQLLTTTYSNTELLLVCGLLDGSAIPYIMMNKDAGHYDYVRVVTGLSVFGSEIYVSNRDHDRAKELIQAYASGAGDPIPDEEP